MNKGFTLMELLAVIVLLILVSMIIFPGVNNIIKESKNTVYKTQVNSILKATYDFTLKHPEYLGNLNEISYITLSRLKVEGLIDAKIINPNTYLEYPDNLVISISNVGSNYKRKNSNSYYTGDYLYELESDRLVNVVNSPNISITGNNINNNLYLLDLEEEFIEPEVSAVDYNLEDITSNITKIIYNDKDNVVDSINNTKFGSYKIKYVVLDEYGNSGMEVLNVIVGDDEAPTISFPSNNEIDITTTSYDLYSGVTCTDNSGYCTISYTGNIAFGVKGSNVIEYTAVDYSGNTYTKKRVITVK